jgi:hypothetical protein
MIAMQAVGLGCAACDDKVLFLEPIEINKFTSSLESTNIPDEVKEQIENLTKNMPSIDQAFELASKLYSYPSKLFESIIEVVINADNKRHSAEMNLNRHGEN